MRLYQLLRKGISANQIMVACLSLFFWGSSCSSANPDMELAKRQCDNYYKFLKERQVDSTLQLFGVQADIKTRNQLIADLDANRKALGNVVSASRYTTKVTKDSKDGKNETQVAIVYKVQYDSSYLSKEVFYFHMSGGFVGRIDSLSCEGWEEAEKKNIN